MRRFFSSLVSLGGIGSSAKLGVMTVVVRLAAIVMLADAGIVVVIGIRGEIFAFFFFITIVVDDAADWVPGFCLCGNKATDEEAEDEDDTFALCVCW